MRGTLEKIKKIGYDGVEFGGLYGHAPEEVKEMCDSIGLVPISAHISMKEMLERPEVFEEYKRLGCKDVAIPYFPIDLHIQTGKYGTAIAYAKKIGKAAKDHALQLLYHNHDFDFTIKDGEYALDILYTETSPDE